MNILKAIILGIVQGITEFLPISSSGHLSLFQHFLNVSDDTSLLFSVLLHMGTLIAVFIVYYKTIWELVLAAIQLIKKIFTGKFKFKQLKGTERMLVMFFFSCVPLLLLLIPIGGGRNIMDALAVFSEDDSILVEGICFLFTGALLLTSTIIAKRDNLRPAVNTTDAIAIGVAQLLAAGFPGISRSGSTISTGMICGVSKEYMVRYSFILGIPAILAANAVELKDAIEVGQSVEILPVIIGVVTAAVVGVACIKLLEWIMKKDLFKYFGYYCLALGVVTIGCSIFGL